jgi:DNA-binding transcriptional MocR family regulator
MGSFSKTLAAGLRVGWLTADAEMTRRQVEGGLLDSGGGINQFSAMVVMRACLSGGYETQLARYRSAYIERRDALLSALADHCPGCVVETPQGGFFVWLKLPAGMDGGAVAARALEHQVSCLPGVKFDASAGDGQRGHVRLCFALYPPATLREGARRLGQAIAGL